MKKKVLLIGTSHAADVSRCIDKYLVPYFDGYHFDRAFFGVNLWRLVLNKGSYDISSSGLVSKTSFSDYPLSDMHIARLQNFLDLLHNLFEYDVVIFVDMFFKGWDFVPNVFSHVDSSNSSCYLKSISGDPVLSSLHLISAIPQVGGSFYGINGLYSEYIDSSYQKCSSVPLITLVSNALAQAKSSNVYLVPAPMHPSVVTQASKYDALVHFRSKLCSNLGVQYINQDTDTLTEHFCTQHHYSSTFTRDPHFTYDDPKSLDGHMNPNYWLTQFSFLYN